MADHSQQPGDGTPRPIDDALGEIQSGEIFARFLAQLEGLTESMAAMAAVNSRMATMANQELAGTMHPPTGRSGDRSPTASAPEQRPLEHLVPRFAPKRVQQSAREVLSGQTVRSGAGLSDEGFEYAYDNEGSVSPVKVWGARGLSVKDRLKLSAGAASERVNNGLQGRNIDPANVMAYTYAAQQGVGVAKHAAAYLDSKNPQNVGSELGYARDGGPLGPDLGPFQIPGTQLTTKAGRKGISEWWNRTWKGWTTPGLSGKDIGEIQGALYNQGWVEGPARDHMMDGLIKVKQQYKGMDTNAAASMMDQGTRYGNNSVSNMVDILKSIPDAAHAAGLGMNEMVSSIDNVANASQKQGATYAQGAAFGAQALATTGRDPRLSQQLSENPFVQSRIMAQTGILPQAQGALDPNDRLVLGAKALREQYNIYRGMRDIKRKDPLTGDTYTVSGKDQAIAMVAQQTGLSPDVVRAQLGDEKRETLWNELTTSTRTSGTAAHAAGARGDFDAAGRALTDTRALETMRAKGIISEKDVQKVWDKTAKTVADANNEQDPKRRQALLDKAGDEKLKAIQELATRSTKDFTAANSGQDHKIDLTDRAAGWFRIVGAGTPKSEPGWPGVAKQTAKREANAGGSPWLNSSASKIGSLAPKKSGPSWPGATP